MTTARPFFMFRDGTARAAIEAAQGLAAATGD
jgi:hypothetical protein